MIIKREKRTFLPSQVYNYLFILVLLSPWINQALNLDFNLFQFEDNVVVSLLSEENIFLIFFWFIYLASYFVASSFLKLHLNNKEKNISKNLSIFIPLISVFLYFGLLYLTYGDGIFYRLSYIPSDIKGFRIILDFFGFFVVFALVNSKNRIISLLLFLIFILLASSTASRIVIVYFIFYIFLGYFSYKIFQKKHLLILLIIFFLFSAFLLGFRDNNVHGLSVYYTLNNFESTDIYEKISFFFYYSFAYSYYLLGNIMQENALTFNYFYISINPLPGSMVGWYDIYTDLRLNGFVPYSAIGEIYLHGVLITILSAALLGILFRHLDTLYAKGSNLFGLIILIVVIIISFYSWQYNLRSLVRIIYYFYICYSIYYIYNILTQRLK